MALVGASGSFHSESESVSQDSEDGGGFGGESSIGGGDVRFSSSVEAPDDGVAYGGHGAGGAAGSDTGAVFVESDVADVVELVLDVPVLAYESEELVGGGGARREAREHVARVETDLAFVEDPALKLSDLGDAGPLKRGEQVGAHAEEALLQAVAMPRGGLRGSDAHSPGREVGLDLRIRRGAVGFHRDDVVPPFCRSSWQKALVA